MQNLYPYTRYFQPSKTYTDEFLQRFLDGLNSVDREMLKNPLNESPYTFKEFEMPFGLSLTHYYYNILFAIAKWGKVKLMWRNLLNSKTLRPIRGLYIIGEENRVELIHHIINHYIRAELGYINYIKANKKEECKRLNFGNIKLYASKLIDAQRNTICNYLDNLLEEDRAYEHRLENYIIEQFDLDFKEYRGKKVYYFAITKHYVHKRMLL